MVGFPFGKRREYEMPSVAPTGYGVPPPPQNSIPIEAVMEMKQTGMNNEQIINQLKSQGFSFAQIRDALMQAEIKSAITPPQQPPYPGAMIPPLAPQPTAVAETFAMQREPFQPVVTPNVVEELQRVLEEIIEEKWAEVMDKLKAVDEWRARTETSIAAMGERVDAVEKDISNIQAAVLGKVTEYEGAMKEVTTEIQAFEKMMTKIVPELSENVKLIRESAGKMRPPG